MMKKFLILLLACSPLLSSAAGKSASSTMQVSFTVVEACSVQGTAAAAQVNCTQATPYRIQPAAPATAPVTLPAADAGTEPVTVYF
jgi:hypothetical protein